MRYALLLFVPAWSALAAQAGEAPSYAKQVRPIFAKYCIECHNPKALKGGLDLETHKAIFEGSDNGPVIKPGSAAESVLLLSVEGKGRNLMPPKSKTLRPTKQEIATLRAWIEAGAKDDSALIKVVIPDIKPRKALAPPVKALAYNADGALIVVARGSEWIFLPADATAPIENLKQKARRAPITALASLASGLPIVAYGNAGEPASISGLPERSGNVTDVLKKLQVAHKDVILDLAVSPDGKTLATCSYDTQVKLWEVESGKLLHTLKDHSDAVYGVAFRPDGKMLATCAADRTVKIWDTATAQLRFTFSESTDWNYAVAWRPGGKRIAAAGVDKSIRVWELTEQGGKIVHSVFAHEGPVTKLIYSKDGGTLFSVGQDRVIKAWDAERMVERKIYERQPETVLSMALRPDAKQLALGRYDGIVQLLDVETGKVQAEFAAARPNVPAVTTSAQKPLPKPEVKKVTPTEGRRGQTLRVTFEGNHLDAVSGLVFQVPGAEGKIAEKSPAKLVAEIVFPPKTPASVEKIQLKNEAGLSAPVSFTVDPFPVVTVREGNNSPGQGQPITLPATLVGKLEKAGDVDFFRFEAKKGQQVGVQVLTAVLGSKIEPALQLTDLRGRVLAESNDGVLGYTFEEGGAYALGLRDREFRGGAGMHYRLHVGDLPVVTSLFPLGGQRGQEVAVEIDGVFLTTRSAKAKISADAAPGSKTPVPVTSPLGTPLGNTTIVVGEFPEFGPDKASAAMAVPGTANGRLSKHEQRDIWLFPAKKGERLILETQAQRIGSPLDTVLEVLDAKGNPVPRAVLRCQAKTFVTFRDHDNVSAGIRIDAWNDLAMGDYLYVGSELIKIHNLPPNPDADCSFYATAGGQRLGFLDTTPTHHSMGVPMYKVSIHPPGTTFPPNGFPVFTLNYRNDDGGPGYGRDSRIFFDPPADGDYQVRVSDVRGQHGANCGYRLTIRPPRPDFNVRFSPTNPSVWRGGAVPITISVDRTDGYDGPIALRFENLPPGLSAPHTEMQAGEVTTALSLYAEAKAQNPAKPLPLKLIAEAVLGGRKVVKEALGESPKVIDAGEIVTFTDESEVTIQPGREVKLQVHIERRNGFNGRVPVEVKGLPYGVRVLDIGLNGILITEKETQRTMVLYAEPWVEPTEHPFVVLARREGKNSEHAAKSVLLRVSKK